MWVCRIYSAMGWAFYVGQKDKLKMKCFKTGLTYNENYTLTRKVLEKLQWPIKHEEEGLLNRIILIVTLEHGDRDGYNSYPGRFYPYQ
jgi:hypothetical protein